MARPRKDQEGPTAVERMEEAFWEILAEKPYAQITVGEIAKRAQVNKNAFYYHFDGLGALAAQALDSMLPREMARMLLMNGGPSKGIDEIEANALLRNPDPVSYTHLDVYKRQAPCDRARGRRRTGSAEASPPSARCRSAARSP